MKTFIMTYTNMSGNMALVINAATEEQATYIGIEAGAWDNYEITEIDLAKAGVMCVFYGGDAILNNPA